MDRAERALCWRTFVRLIGHANALKLDVAHQIKAYLSEQIGRYGKPSLKTQSIQSLNCNQLTVV